MLQLKLLVTCAACCWLSVAQAREITFNLTAIELSSYHNDPLPVELGDMIRLVCMPARDTSIYRLNTSSEYTACNATEANSILLGNCNRNLPGNSLRINIQMPASGLQTDIVYFAGSTYYFASFVQPRFGPECTDGVKMMIRVRNIGETTASTTHAITSDSLGGGGGGEDDGGQMLFIAVGAGVGGFLLFVLIAALLLVCCVVYCCKSKKGGVELKDHKEIPEALIDAEMGAIADDKESNEEKQKERNNFGKGKRKGGAAKPLQKQKQKAAGLKSKDAKSGEIPSEDKTKVKSSDPKDDKAVEKPNPKGDKSKVKSSVPLSGSNPNADDKAKAKRPVRPSPPNPNAVSAKNGLTAKEDPSSHTDGGNVSLSAQGALFQKDKGKPSPGTGPPASQPVSQSLLPPASKAAPHASKQPVSQSYSSVSRPASQRPGNGRHPNPWK